jgi:hypothetical protein
MLVIINVNVIVKGNFLYYVKRLKLSSWLKTVFFNKCYVSFINIFY